MAANSTLVRVLLLLLLTGLLACSTSRPASKVDPHRADESPHPPATEATEAARLHQEGRELLDRNAPAAIAPLRRAVHLDPQPRYVLSLATGLIRLERLAESRTLLVLLDRHRAPTALTAEDRALVRRLLAELPQVDPSAGPDAAARYDVVLVSPGARKLDVVKVTKGLFGLGLKDAKAIVDQAPVRYAIGLPRDEADAMKAQLQGAGAMVEIEVAEPRFDVKLISYGGRKLDVVKALEGLLGVGLKDAKQVVDASPVEVARDLTREEAERFRVKLEEAGATVELE